MCTLIPEISGIRVSPLWILKVEGGIWYNAGKTSTREREQTAMSAKDIQSLNEVVIGSARHDAAKLLLRLKRDGCVDCL